MERRRLQPATLPHRNTHSNRTPTIPTSGHRYLPSPQPDPRPPPPHPTIALSRHLPMTRRISLMLTLEPRMATSRRSDHRATRLQMEALQDRCKLKVRRMEEHRGRLKSNRRTFGDTRRQRDHVDEFVVVVSGTGTPPCTKKETLLLALNTTRSEPAKLAPFITPRSTAAMTSFDALSPPPRPRHSKHHPNPPCRTKSSASYPFSACLQTCAS